MKILLIHASAGAGHMKAAEYVYNGIKNKTDHQVKFVDALSLSSFVFKKTYSQVYFFMISKVPWLWKYAFALLDLPFLQPLILFFRRINNFCNTQGVVKYLIEEDFDVIITSHFMPVEIVSALKRKGKIKAKLITVVTDYDVHHIWIGKGVDHYCVATPWTKEKLVSMGVDESKITATGIPCDEKFSSEKNINALKQKLGVKEGMFTALMATGSFGIGPIEGVIQAVTGIQTLVVCGHNKALYETLRQKNYENVVPFPLVDNMHEMMAVSDVMVTKPGGLSITEALVSNLPMIFFSAIPGQETNNIMVLSRSDVGFKGFEINTIIEHIERLKNSPEALQEAREKTKILARPQAVRDIIGLI